MVPLGPYRNDTAREALRHSLETSQGFGAATSLDYSSSRRKLIKGGSSKDEIIPMRRAMLASEGSAIAPFLAGLDGAPPPPKLAPDCNVAGRLELPPASQMRANDSQGDNLQSRQAAQ